MRGDTTYVGVSGFGYGGTGKKSNGRQVRTFGFDSQLKPVSSTFTWLYWVLTGFSGIG